MKTRNRQVDVMRGIGIILMVYGHCCRANSVIALFHMSLFFILSGYCFNSDSCRSLRSLFSYLKRKTRTLWWPYFLYTTIFLFSTNACIKSGIYTNDPAILTLKNSIIDKVHYFMGIKEYIKAFLMEFLFQTETQLGGALWFLQCLFFSSTLFALTMFLLSKMFQKKQIKVVVLIGISVVFLLLGYYCSLKSIWVKGFNRTFSCFWMLTAGYLIKQYDIMRYYRNQFTLVALAILIVLDRYGSISIVANQYPNPVFLVFCSILGWCMVYGACDTICVNVRLLSNGLQCIGQRSIPILALHFLSFKIITFLIMCIRHYPRIYLATFPVIYDYVWVVPYWVVGISLPLLANNLFVRGRRKLDYVFGDHDEEI